MTDAPQPTDEGTVTAPRLVIALNKWRPGREVVHVEAPDRVLRMWGVLIAADSEFRTAVLAPAALPRLRQTLQAVTTELKRSISASLAAELDHLLGQTPDSPDGDELRVRYAALAGWTGALVLDMLAQVEAAAATARRHCPA